MKPTRTLRNLSLALLLASGACAAPAYAQISIHINVAPPPPQYEVVPMIPSGYVWAPGYWGWSGERHVWIRGRTIVQRTGYRWEPDRWEQRQGNYYRTAGYWQRDHDAKPVKMKKEKHSDNGKRGDGEHGRGNKH